MSSFSSCRTARCTAGATADITEVLEELNADLRTRLDMNEYEKGFDEV